MAKKLILPAFFVFAVFTELRAQSFALWYYDTPAVILANFAGGQVTSETGFSRVRITAANAATFRNIASPKIVSFYNKLTHTPATKLRASVDRLTKVSNGKVKAILFYMVNDAAGLSPSASGSGDFCRSYTGVFDIAWPCAANYDSIGIVRFGETAAGTPDFESTIIHEISHTQSLHERTGNDSRYGINKDYVRIAYGGDEGHFFNELQGDQQAAMDEALGNFWGGTHDTLQRQQVISELTNNDDYFLGSHSLLTGTTEMWNAAHKVLIDTVFRTTVTVPNIINFNASGYNITLRDSATMPGQRYAARLYKFCNTPGKFNFNSERLAELYLYMYHKYTFQLKDSALESITRFAKYYSRPTPNQRHRYPANMAMYLAADMETYSKRVVGHPANEKLVSSIFPIGLFDLLTHFDMTDAELQRVLTIATFNLDELPQIVKSKAFLNYFTVRSQLKTLLLAKLYNGKDCKLPGTRIQIDAAAAALSNFCRLPATLALTN